MGKKRRNAWRAAPLCFFWAIWKEKNCKSFENIEQLDQAFKSLFLCSLFFEDLISILDFTH